MAFLIQLPVSVNYHWVNDKVFWSFGDARDQRTE